MPRLDVRPDYPLLVRVLRSPDHLLSLSPDQFSRLIDAAEHARLLGWLVSEVDLRGARLAPPDWLQDRLVTVRALVREYERAVRWEIDRLQRAFSGAGLPWILLKGGAYVAASLPPGRGRRVADIDVLVPFELLAKAEQSLNEHGLVTSASSMHTTSGITENWMHELPPMIHKRTPVGRRRASCDFAAHQPAAACGVAPHVEGHSRGRRCARAVSRAHGAPCSRASVSRRRDCRCGPGRGRSGWIAPPFRQ